MFIKKIPIAGKPSQFKIQICENVREGKKVRQKLFKHVGTAKNESELITYLRCANLLIEGEIKRRNGGNLLFDATECIENRDPLLPSNSKEVYIGIKDIQEESRYIEGPKDIFSFDTSKIGFEKAIDAKDKELLDSLIIERIVNPCSKKKTQDNLRINAGFECSLSKIYRLLTAISKKEDLINKIAFEYSRTIFESKVDILFFDVTTLYFESWNNDELKNFGFSKDCKFGQVQVTLALAVEQNGFPIGYKLFPGNIAEITTLIKCIDGWKKHITIENIIFVADRGMFSFENLYTLQDKGYKFIVACPLRKLSASQKNVVLNSHNYRPSTVLFNGKSDFCWISDIPHIMSQKCYESKEIKNITGRLISSYSTARARKDSIDRIRMIEKVKKKFEKKANVTNSDLKSIVTNKGYGKYLSLQGADSVTLSVNEKKIEEDSCWDGMHGVFTNTDLSKQEVLARYRGLWQIEECFRVSKTELKIRPVFHFTPSRVRGHIALCFMALVTLKATMYRLKSAGVEVSSSKLVEEINRVQGSIILDKRTKRRFRIPSAMSDLSKSVYTALNKKRRESVHRVK